MTATTINACDTAPVKLSVVVPVYREAVTIPAFLDRIQPLLASITPDYEIIFSMDPSPDQTGQVILARRATDERIKLLKFSRRFGQPMATLAGLRYATGQAVVVIDVDLQDPPELIVEMVAKWREGFDVVYARRRSRAGEPLIKKVVAACAYWVINRLADVHIPPDTGDFRLMSRRVVDELNRLKEAHGFLRGLVALVGFRQTCILFDRKARHAGRGNYNRFFGSLRIGLNGMICFSSTLLRFSSLMGFLVAGIAFLLALAYLMMKISGFPFPMGNPTIVILVLFMGGVQLITVGILGEYIGRIYEEVKQRPKFIVDEAHGFCEKRHDA